MNDFFELRPAAVDEIDQIKKLADQNKQYLGFILLPTLIQAQKRDWLIVAVGKKTGKILGFINVWRRRDNWVTVMELCVVDCYRKYGIGVALMNYFPRPLKLKCTIENPANKFYARVGCKTAGIETGKKRKLQKWILI